MRASLSLAGIEPSLQFRNFFLLLLQDFGKHRDNVHRAQTLSVLGGDEIRDILCNEPNVFFIFRNFVVELNRI